MWSTIALSENSKKKGCFDLTAMRDALSAQPFEPL